MLKITISDVNMFSNIIFANSNVTILFIKQKFVHRPSGHILNDE